MSEVKTAISRSMKWRFHQQILVHLTKDLQFMDYAELRKRLAQVLDPYFEQTVGAAARTGPQYSYITVKCAETGRSRHFYYDHSLPYQTFRTIPANLYQQVSYISEQHDAHNRKRAIISKQIDAIFRVVRDLESLRTLFPDITFEVSERNNRKSNVKLANKRLEELNELIRNQ